MLAEKLSGSGAATKTYVEDVFSTYLYTGNGSTQTINNGIDLAGKGGLVWVKNRGVGTTNNTLVDTLRGADQVLFSNTTDSNTDYSGAGNKTVTGFNGSGFSVGSNGIVNQNTISMASWTFRKAPKFFDVVTYTGNGVAGRQIPHSLGVTPGMIVVKRTDSSGSWIVYHRSIGATKYVELSLTAAPTTSAVAWNNTEPTDTVFTIGSGGGLNASGGSFVAYVFAHDTSTDGLIQCGSFTTDASGNATVSLGWEPQYVLWKASSAVGDWRTLDTTRSFTNGGNDFWLKPNTSEAEGTATDYGSPTATGFTFNTSASTTHIYLAIRRGPMKKPTSGTQVYNAIARTGTGAAATVTGVGFPPDLVIADPRNNGGVSYASFWDRLRGATNVLLPYQTAAEAAKTDAVLSLEMDGMKVGADTTNSWVNATTTYINWFFRRYPGVFDQVCYTGDDATGRSIAHNLGVAPELIIVKNRSAVVNWTVYSAATGNTSYLTLNSTSAVGTGYTGWSSTSPTNAAFYVHGSASGVNASGNNYTAHLFATLAGISKVGSYTGNGTSQTIDCGFTAGARFVLIKRTDSTGDWYVWDSTRGIVAANDPHLSLNTTAAEVTTDDSVDPVASGFAVNQLAATNINVNGASYIFLALA